MRMYNQELPQDLSSSLDDRSKVMIDGLPLSCQETHLSAYLSRITDGKVKDIRFVSYKEKKLGVAFVTLLDRKSAKALVSAFERRKSLNTMGQKSTFYPKIQEIHIFKIAFLAKFTHCQNRLNSQESNFKSPFFKKIAFSKTHFFTNITF